MPHAIHDLIAIGMTATGALTAMTRGGAEALGLASKGVIAAEADADMIAVDGDPTVEAEAITRVVGVWKAGREVSWRGQSKAGNDGAGGRANTTSTQR